MAASLNTPSGVTATGLPIAPTRSRRLMASTEATISDCCPMPTVGDSQPNCSHKGTVEAPQPVRMDIQTTAMRGDIATTVCLSRHDIMAVPGTPKGRQVAPPLSPSRFNRHDIVTHPSLADLIAREQLRTRIEAAVARLIDALDAIDAPDEDMEPSNGGGQEADLCRATVDAEAVNEDGSDLDHGEDEEPDEENGDERDWNGDELDCSHDDREPADAFIQGGQGA